MRKLSFALVLLLACDVSAATYADFLGALKAVESGGQPNAGRDVVADGGRSIGPLCISKACWLDSKIPGQWEDCRNLAYAERVAMAYLARYCPSAVASGDWQTMARVFNGGPSGARKAATLGYWRRVEAAMNK